ncbi:MAG: hypothetical protein WC728_16215 [Elusimicrobiota bacterium]
MQKLKRLVLTLAFACVVVSVVGVFYLNHILKAGVETLGPAITGAPVQVRAGVREGGASLKDAAAQVMAPLSAGAARAASEEVQEGAKKGLESLKRLFGE